MCDGHMPGTQQSNPLCSSLLNGSKFLDEFVHFGEIKSLTQRVFLWKTIELLYVKKRFRAEVLWGEQQFSLWIWGFWERSLLKVTAGET